MGIYGEPATQDVLRFCKSELMHALWMLLLDDEFMHAYQHGLRMTCGDGILRRLFPRFFGYSADYPERQVILIMLYEVVFAKSHYSDVLLHA